MNLYLTYSDVPLLY